MGTRILLIAITVSVQVAHAAGPARAGKLVSVHSGACLSGPGQPRVDACEAAPSIAIDPVGRDGRVMLRDEARGECLFSNRDGRFGWYRCTPQYDDQLWVISPIDNAVMVRAHHSSQCLFSNRDGRFGVWSCSETITDQRWQLREPGAPPPIEAPTLAGDWRWSNGSVTALRADGTLLLPNDGVGTWRRIGPRGFEVRWDGGVARVELSLDGYTLSGSWSSAGGVAMPVTAQRARAAVMAAPLDEARFAALLATVRATPSDLTRRDLVISGLAPHTVTADQLLVLLETFRSELNLLDVVHAVAARVVDPQRALAFAPRLRSSVNRARYVKMLSAARPALTPPSLTPPARPSPPPPPPPAPEELQPEPDPFDQPGAYLRRPKREIPPKKTCPPPEPCGLYCRHGYAKDESGCGLCACAPNPVQIHR